MFYHLLLKFLLKTVKSGRCFFFEISSSTSSSCPVSVPLFCRCRVRARVHHYPTFQFIAELLKITSSSVPPRRFHGTHQSPYLLPAGSLMFKPPYRSPMNLIRLKKTATRPLSLNLDAYIFAGSSTLIYTPGFR